MAIKLREKKASGKNKGWVTPYLDEHFSGVRKTYYFPEYRYKASPKTLSEKKDRDEKLQLIQQKKLELEVSRIKGDDGFNDMLKRKTDFVKFFDDFVKNCLTADKRIFAAVLIHFKAYIKRSSMPANQIDEMLLRGFQKHLHSKLQYETPATYFSRFKRVLKHATNAGLFAQNPARNLQSRIINKREKDILTIDEIRKLDETECNNDWVKSAFLFCAFTGLRFVDVKGLRWANIIDGRLKIRQSKTGVNLDVKLHDNATKYLPVRSGNHQDLVFNLPTDTSCLKSLKKWAENAKVEKHVTFHVARHSYGTLLIESGVDIYVTSKLMGHTSIRHTTRYARVNDNLKDMAVSKIPAI